MGAPCRAILTSRSELEHEKRELAEEVGDGVVPLPKDWGGYILRPQRVEFWQGRSDRLHDRVVFMRNGNGEWDKFQLAP